MRDVAGNLSPAKLQLRDLNGNGPARYLRRIHMIQPAANTPPRNITKQYAP